MNIDGTIGSFRFAFLSNNTLAKKVDTLATSGSELHLVGSIEINLFDNSQSGNVYLSNFEYNDTYSLFTAINPNANDSLINIEVQSDLNTDGTVASPSRVIAPEKKALLLTTTGAITNERIIIDIYAKDSVHNILTAVNFIAHFSINWED